MKIVMLLTIFIFNISTWAACNDVNQVLGKYLLKDKLSPLQRSSVRSSEKVKNFVSQWKSQNIVSDNRAFMSSMNSPTTGSSKRMYFDVENSVLKGLNDHVLEDKGLGDAVNNLFNQSLIKRMKEDPLLSTKFSGQYSDFKSLRMSFDYSDPKDAKKISNALSEAYEKANLDFLKELEAAKMDGLWQGFEGQLGTPETWFLAGVGDNALEANMASRAQRELANTSGKSSLARYEDKVEQLFVKMDGIDHLQRSLASNKVLKEKEVLTKIGDNYVLSKEMITILRKNKRSDYSDEFHYLKDIQIKSKSLFGVDLSRSEVDTMTKYFEDIDSMSPPLFVRDRKMIPLEQAEQGLVSVDFAGIGVDNAQAAMVGVNKSSLLITKKGEAVSETLQNVWKEVDNVTDEMHMAQRSYNTAVKEIEPNHSGALFSGDDGMFFPSKSWGNSDKVKLVNELSKKDASKYRVTFVPTKYADGSLISTSNRSEYVVKAEKVEKALRSKVTGVGSDKINFHRAKDMIFAIDYIPTKDGQGVFNLIVKGKELTESELSILRKSFKENLDEGSVAGEVIH